MIHRFNEDICLIILSYIDNYQLLDWINIYAIELLARNIDKKNL